MVFMSSTQLVSPRPTCPPALVEKNGCFALAKAHSSPIVANDQDQLRTAHETPSHGSGDGDDGVGTSGNRIDGIQYEFVQQQVELRCGNINSAHLVIGVYIQRCFAVRDYIVDDLAEWCGAAPWRGHALSSSNLH